MKLEDIEVIQGLMHNLKTQVAKLYALADATNIHVQFNGPSQNQTHMNFPMNSSTFSDPDTNGGDYDWDGAFKFMSDQVQLKINYLRERLKTFGVVIDE